MPLSTVLLITCLKALKWLCFAASVLLVLLWMRVSVESDPAMSPLRAAAAAGIFFGTGIAIGLIQKAIARRTGLESRE